MKKVIIYFAFLILCAVHLQAEDLFTSSVQYRDYGISPLQGRENLGAQLMDESFKHTIRKVIATEDYEDALKIFEDIDSSEYIEEFKILQEKSGAGRYNAVANYSFDKAKILQAFRKNNILFTTNIQDTHNVIIPVISINNNFSNSSKAWQSMLKEKSKDTYSMSSIIVNNSSYNSSDLLNAGEETYNAIVDFVNDNVPEYQNIYIAYLSINEDSTTQLYVGLLGDKLQLIRNWDMTIAQTEEEQEDLENLSEDELNQKKVYFVANIMSTASAEAILHVAGQSVNKIINNYAGIGNFYLRVKFSNLTSFVSFKNQLLNDDRVNGTRTISIAPNYMDLSIQCACSPDELRAVARSVSKSNNVESSNFTKNSDL